MKSIISDIRYMFNVKEVAAGKEATELTAGQVGFYGPDSVQSLTLGAYADLPEEFQIIGFTGKQYIRTPYVIKKKFIHNLIQKAPTQAQGEIWVGTIDHCDCIHGFELNIHVDETSLMDRDGFTWAHRDKYFGMTADEVDCYCKDGESIAVEDNQRITVALYNKIKNDPMVSDLYEVAIGAMVGAEGEEELTEVEPDALPEGQSVSLIIKGKILDDGEFGHDPDDYTHLRGVRLMPSISLNGGAKGIAFEKTQDLVYGVGSGVDLRAEEFDNMNLYTDLNFEMRSSDGLLSNKIKYQFENEKEYHTLTFEYDRSKQDRAGEGDMNTVLVLMGSETESVLNTIKTALTPA